jgi:RNA polymerase sigma-70 factor (ECF subfamily)
MELHNTGAEQNRLFYKLIWPERAYVLRCAIFLTHKTAEAEDLAQETLVKAWRALESFDLSGHGVRPWLLTILRNAWRDTLRSRQRHGTQASLDDIGEGPAAPEAPCPPQPDIQAAADADAMLNDFSDQHIVDALRGLRDDFRWTLLVIDISGLTYQEAATLLQVPVGTVRSRLFRAREMLRNLLMAGKEAAPAPK